MRHVSHPPSREMATEISGVYCMVEIQSKHRALEGFVSRDAYVLHI